MLTIYTKPVCPQCDMLKRHLAREAIPFDVVDVTTDQTAFDTLMARGFRSVPVAHYERKYASGAFLGDPGLRAMLKQVREDLDNQPSAPSM